MGVINTLESRLTGVISLVEQVDDFVEGVAGGEAGVRFTVPAPQKGGRHRLEEIDALLQRYGILIHDPRHSGDFLHFRVPKHQAVWAEYLLLHAGVELRNPPVDPCNRQYAVTRPTHLRARQASGNLAPSPCEPCDGPGVWQSLNRGLNWLSGR